MQFICEKCLTDKAILSIKEALNAVLHSKDFKSRAFRRCAVFLLCFKDYFCLTIHPESCPLASPHNACYLSNRFEAVFIVAEREGFEPSRRFRQHAFQACALDRSAISPYNQNLVYKIHVRLFVLNKEQGQEIVHHQSKFITDIFRVRTHKIHSFCACQIFDRWA